MSVKSKVEIIDEIVAYYNEDVTRRGIDESGFCCYFSDELSSSGDCKVCAVGYCVQNPESLYNDLEFADETVSENLLDHHPLKPEYDTGDIHFLEDLQSLHDGSNFWNSKGLTLDGEVYVYKLKLEYAED